MVTSWIIGYPSGFQKSGDNDTTTKQDRRDMIFASTITRTSLETEGSYSFTFQDYETEDGNGVISYSPKNPLRIDIKKPRNIIPIDGLFGENSMVIDMGRKHANIILLGWFTEEWLCEKLGKLQDHLNWDGEPVESILDASQVAPLIFFRDGCTFELVYIKDFSYDKDASQNNKWNYRLELISVTPHSWNGNVEDRVFDENLITNGKPIIGSGTTTATGWAGHELFRWYFNKLADTAEGGFTTKDGYKCLYLLHQDATGSCKIANPRQSRITEMGASISASTKYLFICKVKTLDTETDSVYVELTDYDSSGNQGSTYTTDKLGGDNDWTELKLVFESAADAAFLQVKLYNNVAGTAGSTAWFRDISVVPLASNNGGENIRAENTGDAHTPPTQIKIVGKIDKDFVDNFADESGSTYTLPNALVEAEKLSFIPTKKHGSKFALNFSNVGGGSIKFTLHNSTNIRLAEETVTVSSTGVNIVELPFIYTVGSTYHLHLVDSAGTATVVTSTLNDFSTAWYKQYYARHTKNVTYYNQDSSKTKMYIGRETVDLSNEFDDGDATQVMNSANDYTGFTFKPTQKKLRKVMFKGRKNGNPGYIRIRLATYDTSTNTQGSTLETVYVSEHELSTTDGEFFALFDYDSLDTSQYYIIYCDVPDSDASNYVTLRKMTGSSLDDTDNGRGVSSTDAAATAWTESTTELITFKTYYPNPISAKIPKDCTITVNSDGTGNYVYDKNAANDLFSYIYDLDDVIERDKIFFSSYAYIGTSDYVTAFFESPFPMKNIKISPKHTSYTSSGIAKIEISTDGSAWELLNLDDRVNNGDNTSSTTMMYDIPSSYDTTTKLYIKITHVSDGSYFYRGMRLTADLDTSSVEFISLLPSTPYSSSYNNDGWTETTTAWTASGSFNAVATDSNTYKYGDNSIKFTRNNTGAATMSLYNGYVGNLDLSPYNYIVMWLYPSDTDDYLDTITCYTTDGTNTFTYSTNIELENGAWNLVYVPLSLFASAGSPSWSDIDRIDISLNGGASGETCNIDGLCFVKHINTIQTEYDELSSGNSSTEIFYRERA